MRFIATLTALPCLVVLLTWLSVRAVNSGAEEFDRALADMDRFAMLEAALHRDVLSARVGVLRNYDPLVRETNALDASLVQLRQIMTVDPAADPIIDRLTAAVGLQERLVETFKSDNALLQNSLAYFAIFSFNLGTPDQGGPLGPAVSALAAAMLRLTLDTSSTAADEVRDRLNQLRDQPLPSAQRDAVDALVAHGQLLHSLLPQTDRVLSAIDVAPLRREQAALRLRILTQQGASRATARQFRLYLYFSSLALVAMLVYAGLQLRARGRALRRRAAFEHVVAAISMRFINSQAPRLDADVEHALADMANCLGSDRAYFQRSGPAARTYIWCKPGISISPTWPTQAHTLAKRYNPNADGTVQVSRVTHLSPSEDRQVLASAGLQGWASVSRTDAEGTSYLLGFDTITHPSAVTQDGELGLFGMALDAIANALARHTLEQERVRLEARLHQARRLETVGALASGVAHNFNNIIGAILGYTEMASEQAASHAGSSRILFEIRRAGERARELVDQILTFGRRREATRHSVDLQTLIAETGSLLRASWPATVELRVRSTTGAAIVSGTPTQLQQVFLNLCNNAAQAMEHVGWVEVAIDLHDVSTVQLLSHASILPGRYVCVSVTDTGVGISDADLERIFEPFFTTRMTGSGLGLATAYEIVREHGGVISVTSVVGHGSRFEVWLPHIDGTAIPLIEDVQAFAAGHGETVMILESAPETLLRDEEILAALGYEPVGFTNAADVRAAYQAARDRFDAVVVGQPTHDMAVFELTAKLHALAPHRPIVLATPLAEDFDAERLIAAGISDVITWPINAAEIATALERCLRQTA